MVFSRIKPVTNNKRVHTIAISKINPDTSYNGVHKSRVQVTVLYTIQTSISGKDDTTKRNTNDNGVHNSAEYKRQR